MQPLNNAVQRGAHLGRVFPVVGRAGVFLLGGADVGAVFHAGHVRWVGPGQEAAGALGRVELLEGAGIDQLLAKLVVLFLRAVAPVDPGGLAQGGHFGDPGDQLGVLDVGGGLNGQALQGGSVHRGLLYKLKNSFFKESAPGLLGTGWRTMGAAFEKTAWVESRPGGCDRHQGWAGMAQSDRNP